MRTLGMVVLVAALGCGGAKGTVGGSPAKPVTVPIAARSDSALEGNVKLEPHPDGVKVIVEVRGMAEPGPKGVHLHENADCSAADAKSAGDHWNPSGERHGLPIDDRHHDGDLGNIVVGEDGSGMLMTVMSGVTLELGERSVRGRALVVHAGPDDGKSQPAGNSGDRLGCAEIR